MTYERKGLSAFVPKGDDRRATAKALVDLADEHGISQESIQSANDGFYITEELADLLYDESDEAPEETTEPVTENPDEAPADSAPTNKKRK